MQTSIKVKNKSTVWSIGLRVRVLDVVSYNGSYFSNTSGKNSEPSVASSDWLFIGFIENAVVTVEPVSFVAPITGTNQIFTLPTGFVAGSVLKSKAPLYKFTEWVQSGNSLTIIANTNSGNTIYVQP